ncbi:MAG: GYF domain-containing protein, partial [Myxococcales bacterium]
MKFLCPSCKAKYQIADEKVAGRSVRMKCRKCGFMIQVSSAIAAPSSLESEPPEMGDGDSGSAPPPAPPPEQPPVVASPTPPPARAVPATAAKPTGPKGAPVPAPRPPPGKPAGPVPKPAAPPPRASAPRAAAAPVGPTAAARPAAAAAPAAPAAAPAAAAFEMPRDFEGEDEVTRMADAGALAGAFTQAFGGAGSEAPAAADAPLSMPGDEWFVGINGGPVGPIRWSELRSKAASGAVSKESLVWRDGFEDWRPLKTYPELLAIVEEGVSSARASLTPFTPPASEAREV